jgi:hypothetical protein
MAEIMNARSSAGGCVSQADLLRDPPEHRIDVLMEQLSASLGDKEVRATRWVKVSITPSGISPQYRACRLMQRHQA